MFCETNEQIEAAHVVPTGLKGEGRGLDRRYRDVLKHPDCYRPMCKRCHRTFDKLARLIRAELEPAEEPIPF